MATGASIYAGELMSPMLIELLSIAFDASYTHMYAPGTQRHIKAALEVGATMEEVMEVLKLCVVQGVQACNLGVPNWKKKSQICQMGISPNVEPASEPLAAKKNRQRAHHH